MVVDLGYIFQYRMELTFSRNNSNSRAMLNLQSEAPSPPAPPVAPPPPTPPPLLAPLPTVVQFLSDLSSSTIPENDLEHMMDGADIASICSRNSSQEDNKSLQLVQQQQEEEVKSPSQQPSPREVAQEISRQFRHCLPHTHGESDLHRAAFEGDATQLQLLLDSIEADPMKAETINQRNRLGCTPVRLAATGGHLKCLTKLLEAGANIHIVDVKCQTPLFVAVKNRRSDCARKLLEWGANPDGDMGNSSTPLYVAMMNDDVKTVLLLLEFGADPDKLRHVSRITCNLFKFPRCGSLEAAIEYLMSPEDSYIAAKALLLRGCKTETFEYHNCVYHDRCHLIELLYEFGVPANRRDSNGRLATELNVQNYAKKKLAQLRENPRTLLSSCRIAIMSLLPKPRQNLQCLDNLPLPSPLIAYLRFSDL